MLYMEGSSMSQVFHTLLGVALAQLTYVFILKHYFTIPQEKEYWTKKVNELIERIF